jgi:hypothetical protein
VHIIQEIPEAKLKKYAFVLIQKLDVKKRRRNEWKKYISLEH